MKTIKKLLPLFIILAATLTTVPASAQVSDDLWQATKNQLQPLQQDSGGPFGAPVDIRIAIAWLIKYLLTIVGLIFLCYIIYAGFTWLTSGGNEEKIRRAQSTLKTGIIGMTIIIFAFAIARFVVIAARCATSTSGTWCGFIYNLTW